VAVIKFDNPTKKVNTLSFSVMHEARRLWDEISSDPNVKSVVFTSAKDSCFIAGADIFDISSVEDKSSLVPIIEEALMFFLKMKERGLPMVAAIHGPALGGGLEWGELMVFGLKCVLFVCLLCISECCLYTSALLVDKASMLD
jgi:enoyl-CoA hydratase/carnithine racemase